MILSQRKLTNYLHLFNVLHPTILKYSASCFQLRELLKNIWEEKEKKTTQNVALAVLYTVLMSLPLELHSINYIPIKYI